MTEQLAGMDAAFLALETPESPMHVVGVLLLQPADGTGFSVDRLRQVVQERLHRMPPFLRRPVEAPLSLDKPYWHYEAEVDVDAHLFRATLPAPGDLIALGDFVGSVATRRLDREKPLWELHVVDGLADGRVALVAKVHHSTLYGAAGAEFIAELLDLSPEGAPAETPPPADHPTAPGTLDLLRRTTTSQLRRPLDISRLVVAGARNAVGGLRAVTVVVRRHGREAVPTLAPRTSISGSVTERRVAAFAALSLEETRAVKDAAGVKLNDVVLATVAIALRRYLLARDALPGRDLVAGVPVNAGEGEAVGTNTLATMLVALPTRETDAAAVLTEVHASSVAAKEFTAAIGPSAVAELAELTPPAALSLVTWLMRSAGLSAVQPALANLIVSNVMGPPIPLYLAGARVDAIYPLGPLLQGAGLNLTVLSNVDRLDVGILACPDLVDDVWELIALLPDALAELTAATR